MEATSQVFSSASVLASPPHLIPLLITTTANEAGSVVGSLFPTASPANNATYQQILSVFVGADRAGQIIGSPEYAMTGQGDDTFRTSFERLVTDGVWRCASRAFADRWAESRGNVWVGEWTRGSQYVTNNGNGYCKGRVCHEVSVLSLYPYQFEIAHEPG
jgi:hypothetical protein